jgi:hypothetical protein
LDLAVTELAKLEKAEAQLDQFIERRAREALDASRTEELWAEGVRRHHARQREENAEAWRSYHLRQALRLEATAAELARGHRARAEALLSPGAS